MRIDITKLKKFNKNPLGISTIKDTEDLHGILMFEPVSTLVLISASKPIYNHDIFSTRCRLLSLFNSLGIVPSYIYDEVFYVRDHTNREYNTHTLAGKECNAFPSCLYFYKGEPNEFRETMFSFENSIPGFPIITWKKGPH